MINAGRRTDFRDKNRELFFGELFSGELFSGAALLPENFVPINVRGLWSGFIFPELEHLYKNVFTASFPKRSVRNVGCSFVSKKRTRSGSNVSSRVARIDPLTNKSI